ncbi:unnamed protein product [Spirodela intermedia]|uniref:Protein kinase domain-containing protein n=1 Tax=Spirodela intermedia TaxID=51605 RepID=A0A7I8KMA4_SPIIN|nr:unnamed protein product [Spirodela intermedia]
MHYSTGFTSVHGEGPSAEYAKLRKESLETEFGATLGTYSSKTLFAYYRFGPFLALYRAAIISFQDIHKRAVKFRETLVRLGPFYIKVHALKLYYTHHYLLWNSLPAAFTFFKNNIHYGFVCLFKFHQVDLFIHFHLDFSPRNNDDPDSESHQLGQALSTRPDILPKAYCQELSKLQPRRATVKMLSNSDQIPPFPTHVAIKLMESQLGAPIKKVFADISLNPVASASLGQVYKAHLHSGETVAVKVQRPGMPLLLTLDALLFDMIGGQLKRFAKAQKDLLVAVNEMQLPSSLVPVLPGNGENGHRRGTTIKVPKIYWEFTRKAVLTMEWIDGIKLTDSHRINEASLNKKDLIDQGMYCSLRQLLEEGFFHADPHPGNLVATTDGSLAYFDFGMMGDIPRHYRVGLIQMLVHFVNRDPWGLANDFLSLGFVPDGTDLKTIADALQTSFGDSTRQLTDFQSIMNQLYDVMYEFNFSLPPDYALVVRALGSLEGTAKALDPDFKVVESAYPFVIGRLLSDPSPDMRKILRELLIRNDGSTRWNRLERLITAIFEEASQTTGEESGNPVNAPSWRSFDMRAVVSATEDLLLFILSEKGRRVRIFLVRDIIEAVDAFLREEKSLSEGDSVTKRVVNGLLSLRIAVRSAPEVWAAMLLRVSLRAELHQFIVDVVSALVMHSWKKIPETFWLFLSRLLHKVKENI